MKQYILFFVFVILTFSGFAQKDHSVKKDPWTSKEIWVPVPINRQHPHDKIDKLQLQADAADGKTDNEIEVYGNKSGSKIITEAFITNVNHYQVVIENLPLDHWKKVTALGNLEEFLKHAMRDLGESKKNPSYCKDLIQNFETIYRIQDKEQDLAAHINANFNKAFYGSQHMFKKDKGAINALYKNLVRLYPDEMSKKFNEFSNTEAASDMMTYIAPKNTSLILTYAKSTSAERTAVRNCKDPLVMKIVEIADKANNSLRAIVYLDELYSGTMTMAQVNAATADNTSYFKSLVLQRTKPNVMTKKVLERESKLQALEYVRIMNELHDSPDPVRFKCVEPLSAREMYYLMVLCSDEIYTSTFVGTFNRMLTKMAPMKGDEFLASINMDKFRTFIRMSAGYNKLDQYLNTIDPANKNTLMASFVHNIDKNIETDVEDAVDVADAIGSIKDVNLIDFLLEQLKADYERTYQENNKRGLITYFLLHTLSTSIVNPDATSEDLQTELKVPPIAFVPYQSLLNDKNEVIQQVFFYGDEDGKASYNSFISNYKSDDWKIEKNANWITMSSIKGNKTTIYANLPLDEPKDEDAQKLLNAYLVENSINPTVITHRGHSYHLPTTLSYLNKNNKVIILGSCGGYHNLSSILTSSEDAHIISSKQTGTMRVTDPIVKAFNSRILAGKDINWIELWAEVGAQMNNEDLKDKFNDYVPPHKNMGALFLKAFKIQMQENGML